jgi:hypothetical protein
VPRINSTHSSNSLPSQVDPRFLHEPQTASPALTNTSRFSSLACRRSLVVLHSKLSREPEQLLLQVLCRFKNFAAVNNGKMDFSGFAIQVYKLSRIAGQVSAMQAKCQRTAYCQWSSISRSAWCCSNFAAAKHSV